MKTIRIFSLCGLVAAVGIIQAQENPKAPVSKMQVCQVEVQWGGAAQFNQNSTLADFQKLAPESKLLKSNMSGYQASNYQGFGYNGAFSVLMGIRFSNPDKSGYKMNPLLRLGFTAISSNNLASSYYQDQTSRFDTLVSNQTGQVYYLDSSNTRYYYMNYHSQQLRLDASLIYRTDQKARWAFYSGIGINFGVSLNAATDISYTPYNTVQSNNTYYYQYNSTPPVYTSTNETFRNANNISFAGYVPLGIDFRMGKKRPFWQKTHLFLEMRPGASATSIPELGTFASLYFQTMFGIRVNWESLQ